MTKLMDYLGLNDKTLLAGGFVVSAIRHTEGVGTNGMKKNSYCRVMPGSSVSLRFIDHACYGK